VRQKTCKACKRRYTVKSHHQPFQNWCSIDCGVRIARDKQSAMRQKAERKRQRERREKLKTRGDHMREAQVVFNKFIRLRDKGKGCISCDKPATWGGQWHAGHFIPVGRSGNSLRFFEQNCHRQCSECNNHKSGNLVSYRASLVDLYGESLVEWLEKSHPPTKMTIDEIKSLKSFYKERIKEIEAG
jgi:hypothetical protein